MNFFNKFNKLKNNYKDKKFISLSLILGIFGIFFVTLGSSYAYITYRTIATDVNKISAGTVVVDFKDESSGITLDKAIPQTDDDAIKNNPEHIFYVSNSGKYSVRYKLSFINTCNVGNEIAVSGSFYKVDKCIPIEYIKVAIKADNGPYMIKSLASDDSFDLTDMNLLEPYATSSKYSIKIWLSLETPNEYSGIDENGNEVVSAFTGKVNIFGEQIVTSNNTDLECFNINDAGYITDYNCYYANKYGFSTNKYVVIPSKYINGNITGISANAFTGKNILEVEIPNTITTIEDNAFSGNPGLNVTFTGRGNLSNLIIGTNAFDTDANINYMK